MCISGPRYAVEPYSKVWMVKCWWILHCWSHVGHVERTSHETPPRHQNGNYAAVPLWKTQTVTRVPQRLMWPTSTSQTHQNRKLLQIVPQTAPNTQSRRTEICHKYSNAPQKWTLSHHTLSLWSVKNRTLFLSNRNHTCYENTWNWR